MVIWVLVTGVLQKHIILHILINILNGMNDKM
jgi:hypothetical protein